MPKNNILNGEFSEPPDWLFDDISEISKHARAVYYMYISFLIFSALTVVNASDHQLILNELIHLPIIDLNVSLNGFSLLAPLIAIIIFTYFQLNLNQLKICINSLKEFKTKRKPYVWLINIAADPDLGTIGKIQKCFVNFTLWWLLPIVLWIFPLWFIRRHDPIFSYLTGILPILGILIVFWFRSQYESVKLKQLFRNNPGMSFIAVMVLMFEIFYMFFLIPWAFDGGKFEFLKSWLCLDLSYKKMVNEYGTDYATHYWADLKGIHLEGANLSGSILKKANLEAASLTNADLRNANLEGARLVYACLQGADLRETNLKKSNLWGAVADEAVLLKSDLTNANLERTRLRGAIFTLAILDCTNLKQADFYSAKLEMASLRYAKADSTNFIEASLRNSNLENCSLLSASLRNANLNGANLRGVKNLSLQQLLQLKTLHNAKLDSVTQVQMERNYPSLLKKQ